MSEKENTELKINIFGIIDSTKVYDYLKYFGDSNWDKIDFKKFSKYYNKDIDNYNFSLDKIIEQL